MLKGLMFNLFSSFSLISGIILFIAAVGGCSHGSGSWKMNVLLDNDAVQLLEVDFNAGSKTPRHYHRDALIYTLSDAHVRITGSDGKPLDLQLKSDQVIWRDAELRTLENIGSTSLHVLNFDLKKAKKSAKPAVLADDPLQVSPEIYSLLLDNHRVRVLRVDAKPGIKTPLHAYPDAVLYFLSDTRLRFLSPNGKPQELDQKKGDAVWLPAQVHTLEALGDAAAIFLVVEMKPAT